MSKPDTRTVANNQRLFQHYYEKLSQVNDETVFLSAATAFTQWLGDQRAYYATARQPILEIITAAALALRRATNQPDNIPFHISHCPPPFHRIAESYANLVNVVCRWKSRFSESALQERIEALEKTVAPLVPTHTLVDPSPFTPVPSSSATTPPVMDQAQTPPTHASSSTPPVLSRPTSASASPSVSTSTSVSAPPHHPAPTSTPTSSSAPPAKKRKIALKRSSFLQMDVDHWKHKRDVTNDSPEDEQVTKDEDREKSETFVEPNDTTPSGEPNDTTPSVEPNATTTSPEPDDTITSVSIIDKEPTSSADIVMADTTTDDAGVDDAEVDDFLQNITPSISDRDRSKSLPMSEGHSAAEPEPSQDRSQSPRANTASLEPDTKVEEESNQQDSVAADVTDVSQGPTQDSLPIADEDAMALDPVVDASPEPVSEPTAPAKSPSPSPTPSVPNHNVDVARSGDVETELPSIQPVATEEDALSLEHYDGKPIVIGLMSGSTTAQMHTLGFNLSQLHLDLLSQWNKRFKIQDDLASSLSLSLAVYSLPICMNKVEQDPTASPESVLDGEPMSWPVHGQIQAKLNNAGWLALYPPWLESWDHLVEFGQHVHLGQNTFQLYHAKDFENYVFVLRLRPPTIAQLEDLRKFRDSQLEWRKSLSFSYFKTPRLDLAMTDVPEVKTRRL